METGKLVRRMAVTATLATLILQPAGPALADFTPSASGWWWIGRPTEAVPAPAAPDVPAGGLYVAGGPAGSTGISAVRYDLAATERTATLVLPVAESAGTLSVVACPSNAEWEQAESGSWDKRAQADCSTSVTGVVNDDRSRISFDLWDIQESDGLVDIVLGPGMDPATGVTAQVEVAFNAPELRLEESDTSSASDDEDPDREHDNSHAEDDAAGQDGNDVYSFPSAPGPTADSGSVVIPQPPALGPVVTIPDQGEAGESRELDIPTTAVDPPRKTLALGSVDPGPTPFAYPGILALPLILIGLASYLGWALSHPVTAADSWATASR